MFVMFVQNTACSSCMNNIFGKHQIVTLHTSLSFMSAFSYILLDVRFSSLNYLELEELDVTSSLVVCVGRDQGN